MRSTLLTATALSFVLLTGAAAASTPEVKTETNYEAKDNGGYTAKEKAESTDANGTTTERVTSKKVDVDSNGNKETTVETKSSTDPKGMFNKTSTEVKNKKVEKEDESKYSHKKIINGKTVEENTDTSVSH
jgi:hypothetical protein